MTKLLILLALSVAGCASRTPNTDESTIQKARSVRPLKDL